MEIGPGTIKFVSVIATRGSAGVLVEEALLGKVRPDDIRRLSENVFLVYADGDTATVRDWLAGVLEEGESVFVGEFEQWSGYGPAVDRSWLLKRGH